jgi:pteridine reductase
MLRRSLQCAKRLRSVNQVRFKSSKCVVVTGGAVRIGKDICLTLAKSGYDIIVHCNRNTVAAEGLIREIHALGREAAVLQADFLSNSSVERLVSDIKNHPLVAKSGGLHGLVLNASLYESGCTLPSGGDTIDFSYVDREADLMRRMLQVHVFASHSIILGLLNELRAGNIPKNNGVESAGSVVAIVDPSQGRHWPRLSSYCASKSALQQLMKSFAGDLAPYIRCNCVAPGAIFAAEDESIDEDFDGIKLKVPLKRAGTSNEIADAVQFLMSNGYMNGHTLVVDGGLSLL